MKNNIKDVLNTIVYNGILPIAFLDSHIIKSEISNKNEIKLIPKMNKKYNQYNLPDGNSSVLLSKIYEIY